MSVHFDSVDLHAESVHRKPFGVEGREDFPDLARGLPSTHRPDRDDPATHLHSSVLVHPEADEVVAQHPSLQYGHPGDLWVVGDEVLVVLDGTKLMLANREPGRLQSDRFAHPVLRGGPRQVPDLGHVELRVLRVQVGVVKEPPMLRDLREAPRIQ